MPDQRQQKRLDRISKTNPERAKRVEQRMNTREERFLSGGKSKLKHNRPDTPLAATPDSQLSTSQFEVRKAALKKDAEKALKKGKDSLRGF
jgi:hypothetical protein